MKPHSRLTHQILAHLPLAGILALCLVLNLSNAGFPLGFHADEATEVDFIKTGTQDFHHPLLMLQLVRAARFFLQPATDQELVEVGRVLMGVSGVASVLFMFVLARQRPSRPWALGAALAVGCVATPGRARALSRRAHAPHDVSPGCCGRVPPFRRPSDICRDPVAGPGHGSRLVIALRGDLAAAVVRRGSADGRQPAAQTSLRSSSAHAWWRAAYS